MLCAAAAIVQVIALMLSHARFQVGLRPVSENLPEAAGAADTVLLSLLLARVQDAVIDGAIVSSGCHAVRWAFFAGTLAAALFACLGCASAPKCASYLGSASASALVLPPAEAAAGRFYPVLFCAAVAFWLAHSTMAALKGHRELRSGISASSVKEAMDRLHTGLLFCEENGWIVLCNLQMKRLMAELGAKPTDGGREFYSLLREGRCAPGCRRMGNGGTVYRLRDGTVWLFSSHRIQRGRRRYAQLTAADVTESWHLGEVLMRENAVLAKNGEELKTRLADLRRICREEETDRVRSQVHDYLGQRITILLRALRAGEEPDSELLAAFSRGLPADLRELESPSSAQEELDVLRDTMAAIGVDVEFEGKLPGELRLARVFADVCTEAAANSVRHGFATRIRIECRRDGADCVLTITDNGSGAEKPIKEGSGIGAMRRKLAALGGTLTVAAAPVFTLTARAEEGEIP
jgi:signal transduction histidine kinase